jgi:hypothetical protein
MLGTYSPFVSYDAGIKTVKIWMPNYRSWRPTSGM